MALNHRQQRFVDEYLVTGNATHAAIAAGYSEKTAASQASDLLRNPKVAEAVAEGQAEMAERAGVTQDMVMAELAAIGFADLGDFATWDEDTVSLIASSELDPVKRKALREVVAQVTTFEGERGSSTTSKLQVRQHDKLKALELLGKQLGMFKDTTRVEFPDAIEVTFAFKPERPE